MPLAMEVVADVLDQEMNATQLPGDPPVLVAEVEIGSNRPSQRGHGGVVHVLPIEILAAKARFQELHARNERNERRPV